MIQKRFIMLLALPLMLAGCSRDDAGMTDGPGTQTGGGDIAFEIGFAPTAQGAQTRVATDAAFNSTWQTGDAIGIFAVPAGTTLSATAGDNYINNVRLTYTETTPGNPATGSWSLDNGVELYWPTGGGGKLDFYAYYPYDEDATDPTAIAFDVKTEQNGTTNSKSNYNLSDLLTARSAAAAKGAAVPLIFSHALAMVQVDISDREVNVPNYNWSRLTVTLKGVGAGAALDLSSAEVTADDGGGLADVTMMRVPNAGTGKWVYRALVPAQSLPGGVRFTFRQDVNNNGSLADYDDFDLVYTEAASPALTAGAVKRYEITVGWGIDPAHVYAVGDPYPHVGRVVGVVYEISDGGLHGKIVSLSEGGGALWSTETVATGATSETDGLANMRTIADYIADNKGNDWSYYRAFEWVNYLNPDGTIYSSGAKGVWYLPAIDELAALYAAWNGDRDAFDDALVSAGGTALRTIGYYSSTESNEINARYINFNGGVDVLCGKRDGASVRAVLAF